MKYFDSSFLKAIREKDFQAIVKYIIESSDSVLDVGCGIGDYLKYTNSQQRVVGIEPHVPYLEKAGDVAPWAQLINLDALSFFEKNNEKFDCILLIGVVEHLEEEAAVKLVQYAKQFAKSIVFSQIPIGEHTQTEDVRNLGGEYWQNHKSTWDENNIEKLGFSFVKIWRDWYDWDNDEKSRDTAIAFWSEHPLVSVVVPTYNQAEWLPKSLDSIIEQTYPFWEAVVVNDGSTDDTPEVLREYTELDNRIRVIHKENGGISSALNTGIQNAKGKYFCWLSSDDLFYPDKLERQVEVYQKLDDSYGIVFGAFDLTDPDDNVTELKIKKPFIDGYEFARFLKYDYIDGCTVMIPLDLLKDIDGFNTQFKHAQDTELWFRLAAKGYRFFYIPHKLTLRRVHPEQGFSDFGIDCRYDGYWMIHFYLTNFSFRNFFQHVNFNNRNQRWQFIKFFYDLLSDPDHLVNHPTLHEQFWNWFSEGMLTLDANVRSEILQAGITAFKKAKEKGEWWRYVHNTLLQLYREIKGKPPKKIQQQASIADITRYDRAKDGFYSEKIYNFGLDWLEEKKKPHTAFHAFKYLADSENPFYNKTYKKFIQISNQLRYFDKYIRSFRRKPDIRKFADYIKIFYIWSLIETENTEDVHAIVQTIKNKKLREKARLWLSGRKLSRIPLSSIRFWNYRAHLQGIEHQVTIKCPHCNQVSEHQFTWSLLSEPQTIALLCPHCYSAGELAESSLVKYFRQSIKHKDDNSAKVKTSRHVYFVLRYTNVIGGGVKKVFQYIDWLDRLGCRITIYSDAPYPSWRKLPGNFILVKDHYEDQFPDADFVVVFSIYDVPKVLCKVPAEIVAHFCQGYEGYHIGDDFEDMRRDKYFYTALHSLPVKNILVSGHLMQLFQSKFAREGYYIPNGIDLSVFHPVPEIHKIPYSILFIGNPFDRLKGFKFLVDSLGYLQNRGAKLPEIKLYVIWGGENKELPETVANIPGLKIHYQLNLSSKAVARLIQSVMLVISASWYEGFSMPVLEAMACGTPVITTNNMGAESFCKDGVNGYIVNYGDFDRISSLIYAILKKELDVLPVVNNGIETAQKYSMANSANHFIEVFENLLNFTFDEKKKDTFRAEYNLPEIYRAETLKKVVSRNMIALNPVVSIIVLTYNALNFTRKCLESILKYTRRSSYELIIVDNGSSDGTVEYLRKMATQYAQIWLIENAANRGFAAGNNQGAAAAKGKYLLFLNNDVLVSNGWLEGLVKALEADERIGAVGPMTNRISGRQSYSRIPYRENDEKGFHEFAGYVSRVKADAITPRRRLAGFALLMRKNLFQEIGGFDESYGTGNFEDDDLCLRIREKGYLLMVNEEVYIHHFGSQTFKANQMDYQASMQERMQLFRRKWPQVDYKKLIELNSSLIQELEGKKKKARKLIKEDKLTSAIEELRFVVQENPLDRAAVLELAELYYKNRRPDLALTTLKKLLKLQPPITEALNLAGIITFEAGDINKAGIFFERALQLNPADVEYRKNLAETLIAKGDVIAGIEQYNRVLEQKPKELETLIRLGQLFLERKEIEQAREYFKRALKIDPKNAQVTETLRVIREYKSGKNSPESGESVPEQDKNFHKQVLHQAIAHYQQGDYKQAESGFREALQHKPDSEDALFGMALCLFQKRDFAQSRKYLEKVIHGYPDNALSYHYLGLMAFEAGDYQTAKGYFQRAIDKDAALIEAQRFYGECLFALHDYQNSRTVFQQVLEQKPDDITAMVKLGVLCKQTGQTEQARGYLQQVLRVDPQNRYAQDLLEQFQE